jgi:hypothetical protein
LYAKITDNRDESAFIITFTFVPPEVVEFFKKALGTP